MSHLVLAFLPPVRANAAMADARILFLGRLAEIAGGRERALPLGAPASLAEIVEALGRGDPELAAALAAPSVRVAVNQQIQRGREGRAGRLFQRQAVHVGAPEQVGTLLATAHERGGTRLVDLAHVFQTERAQALDNEALRLVLFVRQLGVAMEIPSRLDGVIDQLDDCRAQVGRCSDHYGVPTSGVSIPSRAK